MLGAAAAASGHTELVGVAFGPVFGPHVSFGGGVAAAAYAASRGRASTGRDIGSPLMGLRSVDVLFVGGAFGVVGFLMNSGLASVGAANWTDSIALTVIISDIVARLIWGRRRSSVRCRVLRASDSGRTTPRPGFPGNRILRTSWRLGWRWVWPRRIWLPGVVSAQGPTRSRSASRRPSWCFWSWDRRSRSPITWRCPRLWAFCMGQGSLAVLHAA